MKTAILGLLALAAGWTAGFSWVQTRPGPEVRPSSKARVTRDKSGKECTFDERGDLIQVVEPLGPTSTPMTGWDVMTHTIAPDGKPYTYDYSDHCTLPARGERDSEGREVKYQYDDQGRLVSITEALGASRSPYRYDPDTRLSSIKEGAHDPR